ncbi:MAG: glycosyltransferase [Patescibacteria group bacterium]|nr:glycosyltransferase [Patescibacteria group bacterium]MDD4610960.1 glycosyltransferase [Patescibacteria group bacterium]
MKLSIIIINYKTKEMTARAVEAALVSASQIPVEIILFDNNSGDGSAEFFRDKYKEDRRIKFISNSENLGFAKAVNQGIGVAAGEYVYLVNSDVILEKDAIGKILSYMERDQAIGILGSRLNNPDGSWQASFGRVPTLDNEFARLFWLYKFLPIGTVILKNRFTRRIVSSISRAGWVSGGSMLIRRKLIEEIGLFDENYFFGVEDMDFCYRAKLVDWKVVYYPLASAVHYHGFSSGGKRSLFKLELEKKGLDYFFTKNYPVKIFSQKMLNFLYKVKIYLVRKIIDKNLRNIEDAVIAVTYACNSRCRMCSIWQRTDNINLLEPEDFRHLPDNLRAINITGGEPFLRDDLAQIIGVIKERCQKAKITISTNGFATDLIIRQIREIIKICPDIGIAVSIDGIGEAHDKIRGITGGYNKVIATIEALKNLGINNLKISFTLGDYNYGELEKVYKLAKVYNLEFSLALVHSSEIYFGEANELKNLEEIKKTLDWLIKEELHGFNLKKFARAYFAFGLKKYAETGKRILPDYSGKKNIFLDPSGNIYPNNVTSEREGNIDKKLGILLNTPKNIGNSWMVCTARSAIKKHWFKAGMWLIKNKLRFIIRNAWKKSAD